MRAFFAVVPLLLACAPRVTRPSNEVALCHLQGTRWRPEAPVLTARGDAPLGHVSPIGALTAEGDLVARGSDLALVGTFSGEGLTLDARVDLTRGGGVALARPMMLPGVGALLAGTMVGLRRAPDGQLFAYPSAVELQGVQLTGRVELPVTCADLTLDSPEGEAIAKRAEAAGFAALGVGELAAGRNPLSAEPAGAAIAQVGMSHPMMVAVLERGPAQTRIAVTRGRGAVWVGWVAAEAVSSGPKHMLMLLGGLKADGPGLEALFGLGPPPKACGDELRVKTRVGGEVIEVGRAAAGRSFATHGEGGDLVEIELGGWFRPAKKTVLLVDARAAQCAPAKLTSESAKQ